MSYDFAVFGRRLPPACILAIATSIEGLHPKVGADGVSIEAVHATDSGDQLFAIGDPLRFEREDLPPGVDIDTEENVLYEINASTSSEANAERVLRFAQTLAERAAGYLLDPQGEEAHEPELTSLEPPAVAPTLNAIEKRMLHLRWYRLADGRSDLAEIYLRLAKETFPLAVPGRFGSYEPFQGRFPRDHDDIFDRLYREECRADEMLLYGKALRSGSLPGWAPQEPACFQKATLSLPLDKVLKAKQKGISAIGDFLVGFAELTGCFFAFAEVNYESGWTEMPNAVRGGWWGGLPRGPQWMTWYAQDYADLVAPLLASGNSCSTPTGVLHRWTEHPADRDELDRLTDTTLWAPPRFRGRASDTEYQGRFVEQADVLPGFLRMPE